jgi:DNA polymerase-3 subunit delta
MAKQAGITYQQIINQMKSGDWKPIYFLMGEEDYYIDKIANYIEDNLLTEDEKEFNMTIIYGKKETSCDEIIMAAKRYPMMSQYQLIMVREAQNIKNFDNLSTYLKQPLASSIIVFCYKHASIDGRKKVFKDIASTGILFESKRKYDNEIPSWITSYVREHNADIEPKAANLLAEFLGTQLSKVVNEVDKLLILLNNSETRRIDSVMVERNIGISKDYNNFELVNAIGNRDILKINRIIDHFAKDPKNNPIVVTTTVVFNFFSNLLLYHSLRDKSQANVAAELKINPYFVKDYQHAATIYNSSRTLYAISLIRELDVRSKGFGDSNTSHRDLLREIMFKITH